MMYGNEAGKRKIGEILTTTLREREALADRLNQRAAMHRKDAVRMDDIASELRQGVDRIDDGNRLLDVKRVHDERLMAIQDTCDDLGRQNASLREAIERQERTLTALVDSLPGAFGKVAEALRGVEGRIGNLPAGGPEAPAPAVDEAAIAGYGFFGEVVKVGEKDRRRGDAVFGKAHPRFEEAKDKATTWVIAKGKPMKPGEIEAYLRGEGGVPEFTPPAKSVGNRLVAMGFSRVRPKVGGGVRFWTNRAGLPREFLSV